MPKDKTELTTLTDSEREALSVLNNGPKDVKAGALELAVTDAALGKTYGTLEGYGLVKPGGVDGEWELTDEGAKGSSSSWEDLRDDASRQAEAEANARSQP